MRSRLRMCNRGSTLARHYQRQLDLLSVSVTLVEDTMTWFM